MSEYDEFKDEIKEVMKKDIIDEFEREDFGFIEMSEYQRNLISNKYKIPVLEVPDKNKRLEKIQFSINSSKQKRDNVNKKNFSHDKKIYSDVFDKMFEVDRGKQIAESKNRSLSDDDFANKLLLLHQFERKEKNKDTLIHRFRKDKSSPVISKNYVSNYKNLFRDLEERLNGLNKKSEIKISEEITQEIIFEKNEQTANVASGTISKIRAWCRKLAQRVISLLSKI